MNGIVFFATRQLATIEAFYLQRIKCSSWLKQADCTILQHGNLLFGFCQRDRADVAGMICFVYPRRSDVDSMYAQLLDIAGTEPQANPKYEIYHFFATDPDGRTIECQAFDHPPAF